MAIEDAVSVPRSVPNPWRVPEVIAAIVSRLTLTAIGLVWVTVWGLVVRIHLQMGDFLAAGLVGVLFVLPGLFGVGYYLRRTFTQAVRSPVD